MSVEEYKKRHADWNLVDAGQVNYRIGIKGITITEAKRLKGNVILPDCIKEEKVTTIGKKAFFGEEQLRVLYLPQSVRKIEDWAFVHCSGLQELWIPRSFEELGKDVFLHTDHLNRIVVYDETGIYEEEAVLTAATFTLWQNAEGLQLGAVGSKGWYEAFDQRLLRYLEEPDDQGFVPFLAGGEEDYEGVETDVEYYKGCRRRQKVRLVYERLRHSCYLETEGKKALVDYLQQHNRVGEKADGSMAETFFFLTELVDEAFEYYQIYTDLGLATRENIEFLVQAAQGNCAELKAYLLRYQQQALPERDAWQQFTL